MSKLLPGRLIARGFSIALQTRRTLRARRFQYPRIFFLYRKKGGDLHFRFTHVMTHDRQMFLNSVWTEPGRFYFLHSEDYAAATPALWKCETAPGASPTRVAFGDTDDAAGLVRLSNEVAVGVACGLETRIEITGPNSISFTAFETSEDAFASWDIKQVNGKYIFVALRSSGVTADVDNIWSGSTVPGTKGVLSTKLSSHHEWVSGKELPQCCHISARTIIKELAYGCRSPWRTILMTNVAPDLSYRYMLASHGFLVLNPNYRGSQGRGNDFAKAARGGMGGLDYADIESMVEAAIKRGNGGYLSAWACTRPNSIWKTAIIGAGATDWGGMAICCDIPAAALDFAGSAPWTPRDPKLVPHYLKGCAMADVKNVKVPVLVLHGEKDAIGFMRGLVREGDEAASAASKLIIYPREGHIFEERAHAEDQLTRPHRDLIIALAKNREERVRRATSQVEHVAVLILTVPFDHKTGSTLGTGTYTQQCIENHSLTAGSIRGLSSEAQTVQNTAECQRHAKIEVHLNRQDKTVLEAANLWEISTGRHVQLTYNSDDYAWTEARPASYHWELCGLLFRHHSSQWLKKMFIKDIDDIPDSSIVRFLLQPSRRTREDLETELGAATRSSRRAKAEAQVAQSLLEEAAAALKSREKEVKLAALCETAARDRVKYLSRLKDTRDAEIDTKVLPFISKPEWLH
ncbi:hypothetical protein B0H14DRAFT_2579542 [Mycena olivaceomarginata]|nr:hypothetical protein B0H14DRAFT_2579542 [Mycena olivaceomarginata]